MVKRAISVAVFVSLIFPFTSLLSAQKEELKAKLTDLKNRKFEMTDEYKKNLHKIEREAEDKLSKIKADFRMSREACLAEKHEKSEGLRKDFEGKLKPMLKEEEELVELIGRDAREDFVRTKAERIRSKQELLKK